MALPALVPCAPGRAPVGGGDLSALQTPSRAGGHSGAVDVRSDLGRPFLTRSAPSAGPPEPGKRPSGRLVRTQPREVDTKEAATRLHQHEATVLHRADARSSLRTRM